MPPKSAKGPGGRLSKQLPSGKRMNDMTNECDFHQFPTDANLASWADAAVPRATLHLAAALKHHVQQTAVGVVWVMKERGVKPRPADDRLQKLLHELRNAWPNGTWYPVNFAPTSSPQTIGLVRAMVDITKLWQTHRSELPLGGLWNQTKGSEGIIRAILERQNQLFTRPAAQAVLAILKAELGLIQTKPKPKPMPASESAVEMSRAVPETDPAIDPNPDTDDRRSSHAEFGSPFCPPLPPLSKTPSPPPHPPPRPRPEVPKDLVIAHFFSRTGMPVLPTTEATVAARLKGFEKAFVKQLRADTPAKAKKLPEDSRCRRQEALAVAAEAASGEEIADDLIDATVRFLPKRAKAKYGKRLSPAARGKISRMFRAEGKRIISELEL
ncbi:hypothetical protein LZ32DRAFT_681036 [Colletotrichum eremochloae]|nr:hypothetical protein LZ32DRAFT_681036 [Colletotrichum eremochloae]